VVAVIAFYDCCLAANHAASVVIGYWFLQSIVAFLLWLPSASCTKPKRGHCYNAACCHDVTINITIN